MWRLGYVSNGCGGISICQLFERIIVFTSQSSTNEKEECKKMTSCWRIIFLHVKQSNYATRKNLRYQPFRCICTVLYHTVYSTCTGRGNNDRTTINHRSRRVHSLEDEWYEENHRRSKHSYINSSHLTQTPPKYTVVYRTRVVLFCFVPRLLETKPECIRHLHTPLLFGCFALRVDN